MKIYNSMSRQKEELIPLEEGKVSIYVCGPTVYNYIHIGNARPMVVFDTLRRYLQYRGYEVKYVQNFTDVDDKIIRQAKEDGVSSREVADKFIKEYFDDADALNVKRADVHPRVSENIPEIIAFVQSLIDKGYAYEADGDVYFETRKFPDYGKLSGQNIDDLAAGARIAVGDVKKDPLDFAVWKAQKEPDEIAWDSPWGKGRPGWHIECSTMSKNNLGTTIDIHGGGEDLKFPHHENEIAQSECANGVPLAKYWMHNGFITINAEKMSKSRGNFFRVRDIRKYYTGEEIRFFLLQGQYRGPIDFSRKNLEQAKAGLDRIKNCKDDLKFMILNGTEGDMPEKEQETLDKLKGYRKDFIAAMDDDLNTADAISVIFEMVSSINMDIRDGASKKFAQSALDLLEELGDVLGILQDRDEDKEEIPAEVKDLLEERKKAREDKNWAKSDEIRDKLAEKGFIVKDTPQGMQLLKE